MKSLFILFASLHFAIAATAQDDDVKEPFPEYRYTGLSDVYIASGGGLFGQIQADFSDFQKLTGTTLLPDSNANFFNTSNWRSATGAFSVVGAWQFGNKDGSVRKINLSVRTGLLFNGGRVMSGRYFETKRHRIDTLYNSSGTQMILVDSIKSFDKDVFHESDRLMFDLGIFVRLFPENRWSMFGGFGIAPGISFNAVTVLSEREYNEMEYNNVFTSDRITNRFYESFTNKNTIIRNKSSWCMLMHLSFGFDVRISNRSTFWRHVHFYMESRPSMFVSRYPELKRSFTQTGGQFLSGIRIRL